MAKPLVIAGIAALVFLATRRRRPGAMRPTPQPPAPVDAASENQAPPSAPPGEVPAPAPGFDSPLGTVPVAEGPSTPPPVNTPQPADPYEQYQTPDIIPGSVIRRLELGGKVAPPPDERRFIERRRQMPLDRQQDTPPDPPYGGAFEP